MYNKNFSKIISNDCKDIIGVLLDKNYIDLIREEFDDSDDAYHYLAMMAQLKRMSNRFEIISPNHYGGYCNYDNIIQGILQV